MRRPGHRRYISLGEYLPEYMPAIEQTTQDELRLWQRKSSPEKEKEPEQKEQQQQQNTQNTFKEQRSFEMDFQRSFFLGQKEE